MQKPDPYGEWVLFRSKRGTDTDPFPVQDELVAAAREAWPHVLAHARRELSDRSVSLEKTALAADVWEQVLRSVSMTLNRRRDHRPPISDLQSYLFGAFLHRFNRVLKREQRQAERIELIASLHDLERLEGAVDAEWVSDLERTITVNQIVAHMDDWTREVWKARQFGYSWKEIARHLGQNEQQTIMKFRYGLEKTRRHMFDGLRRQERKPPQQT
jgi:DNA-directed RNA polymerase specialized sigma24 family protein